MTGGCQFTCVASILFRAIFAENQPGDGAGGLRRPVDPVDGQVRGAPIHSGGGMLFGMGIITGVTAGLSGLKAASDLTTRIREALGSREVKLDEVVTRIIEIQGLISDGRTALIDAQELLLDKTREIARLEKEAKMLNEQLALKGRVRFHDWVVGQFEISQGCA